MSTAQPTPELLAAARAYTLDKDTREQTMLLREENRIVPVERTVARILLDALEAAEQRIKELEQRVEDLSYEVQDANNRSVE